MMNCHCAHITVRREIDSLNERLSGDGQAIEGGDPTKGALKTKGTLFSTQSVSVELTDASASLEMYLEILMELIVWLLNEVIDVIPWWLENSACKTNNICIFKCLSLVNKSFNIYIALLSKALYNLLCLLSHSCPSLHISYLEKYCETALNMLIVIKVLWKDVLHTIYSIYFHDLLILDLLIQTSSLCVFVHAFIKGLT